jgi:hypothetical protein
MVTKTIGMVVVAAFAALAAGVAKAAIMAGRCPINSVASTGSRSYWFSAQRASIVTLRPSL